MGQQVHLEGVPFLEGFTTLQRQKQEYMEAIKVFAPFLLGRMGG